MSEDPRYFEIFARLEPARPLEDLNRGFQAEVFDPVWFLGRQWQLGEHQGEDAGSPIAVDYTKSEQPLEPRAGSLELNPTITPTEAIVEAEIQTWTPGQRIRIGAAVAARKTLSKDPKLMLSGLPAPYDRFNGNGFDGRELFIRQNELELEDVFGELMPELLPMSGEDTWNYEEFNYKSGFKCGGGNLAIERHTGGRLDWYSVDADGTISSADRENNRAIPGRVTFPGAPQPRWWQIENAQVDIGGFPPDRSRFPTMLLVELISSHSNDWFHFPVDSLTGHVLTLHEVIVKDSFGDETTIDPPDDWSLFKVKGLSNRSMVLLPTVPSPLTGSLLESVLVGVNEDANLVWANERRLDGRDLESPERESVTASGGAGAGEPGQKRYEYLPSTEVFNHWHPYVIPVNQVGKRLLVQARLANLTTNPVGYTLLADARLLNGPNGTSTEPHKIEPSAVPSLGLSLTRTFVFGRMTDGNPALWIQRQRSPLISPPTLPLRFDVLRDGTNET